MREITKFGMMMFGLLLFAMSFAGIASADHSQEIRLMINGKYISSAHPVASLFN